MVLEDIRLGQLALSAGLLDEEDLDSALKDQYDAERSGHYAPIGQVLVKRGALTRSQLRRLLKQQKALAAKVTRIGKYRLVALRAEGGMGAVYKAENLDDGTIVALKVLPRSHARKPNLLERFRREAVSGSILDHPNIVKVLDADYADGYHYIAMEYVSGMSTAEMLSESGRLKERDALSAIIQITRALEHIGDRGLVHRDIKPGNILVDQEGVAKLADMGLALWVERPMPRLTLTGRMMGTPFYISPEQARGDTTLDIRSDIYSLGVTLYELVTGVPPFRGKTAAAVLTQHLTQEVPSPREIERTLSDGICYVITRMMAKDRKDRYQTARELMKDLLVVYRGENPKRLRSEKQPAQHEALMATEPLPGEALPRERPAPLGLSRERRFPTARSVVTVGPSAPRPFYFYIAPVAAVCLLMIGVAVGVNITGRRTKQEVTHFVFADGSSTTLGWRGGGVAEFQGASALVSGTGRVQLATVAWEINAVFNCTVTACVEREAELTLWLQGGDGTLYFSSAPLDASWREINLTKMSFAQWPAGAGELGKGLYYNLTLETNPPVPLAVRSIRVAGSRPVLVTIPE